MPRKADETRLQEAQNLLRNSPGEKASYYAHKLGMHRYDFNTLLAMLNDREVYLCEDDNGGLWPYDPDQD